MRKYFILIILLSFSCFIFAQSQFNYPDTKKIDLVEDYHGVQVADPYRWLEDNNSDETAAWVEVQNEFTQNYLTQIPFREDIKNRLTELWNYEKYSAPKKVGDFYIFSKNDGLQEQSVIYIQESLDAEPEVFLDPNLLSDDGSVSLAGLYFSNDNKYAAYAISRGGSDWREIFVMNVDDKSLLEDHINWAKFTSIAWYNDGFFYSRYDEPEEEQKLKAQNEFQKLYYHKIGTAQTDDVLVLEDKENPKRGFMASVTDDEKYLIINAWEGSAKSNLLFYKDLVNDSQIISIVDTLESEYNFVANIDDKFLIHTNNNAPNYRLILIDLENPSRENWKDIIPGTQDVLSSVSFVGEKLIATYMKDANNVVKVYSQEGEYFYDIGLPSVGTVYGFGGKQTDKEVFYTFTSFTYPPTIYRYNVETNESQLFRKSDIKFDMENFETNQVFYESKDGTKIPLFITHKKGLELNGENPTLLYAYGGFNVSQRPSFRLTALPLLENGGVYALACLRGGGEYGKEWHEAGMLDKKQNVYDDYIAAAEYLIEKKYTNPNKLAIQGGSNGGLLVGAVINQRPELFKVAFPMVGVMDMLRFHKFTIGWAWVPEYGSSDDPEQFKFLYEYSPLHNVKSGLNYPATMITTADHDDRVFPAHSFKYAAEMQAKSTSENPILIRIETKVGHGAGTSTSKAIELYTDILSFMFYNLGLSINY
ncbi:MAG TPA: S9 family peptidase [Ignavibacteria bacterium]|nr:S9 family peptidase [Ignavibacteria bacterium]